MSNDEDLRELRRLADAGVRVIEGGAGDPEFDGEFGGPEKWDQAVRDRRRKALEAAGCIALGLFLLAYRPAGCVGRVRLFMVTIVEERAEALKLSF